MFVAKGALQYLESILRFFKRLQEVQRSLKSGCVGCTTQFIYGDNSSESTGDMEGLKVLLDWRHRVFEGAFGSPKENGIWDVWRMFQGGGGAAGPRLSKTCRPNSLPIPKNFLL